MLRLIAVVLAFLLPGLVPLPSAWAEPAAVESDVDWTRTARVAGAAVYADIEDEVVEKLLSKLVKEGVNVVEADSELSNYLTDKQFDGEMAGIRRFVAAAHRHGLRVVWYYPALEVISPRAAGAGRSMYKDHPDWVQLGLNGKPNVFYGGEAEVHWLEKGDESAWMTFESGYGEYFLDRIKRLAATGIDGIWLDVPLLNNIKVDWADHNPAALAAFKKATGMDAPATDDWSKPAWRHWIRWRHSQIEMTLSRIAEAAKSVSQEIAVIIENVTLDNVAATLLGLDGSFFKNNPDLMQVWEIDATSDNDAMHRASRKDWVAFIGMNKFAKGASGDKASWVFTYGYEPEDAYLVMVEAIATGNHPYETRIPTMTSSVGSDYRREMYSWIKKYTKQIFQSRSAARAAVLFSSESRDYADQDNAPGLYDSIKKDDPVWWSNDPADSLGTLDYMAEYRGVVKWLLDTHIPFDVIVDPTPDELAAYGAVIAPHLSAASDDLAKRLNDYVAKGGMLTVTGPEPTGLDEFGKERSTYAINKMLRRAKQAALPWSTKRSFGKGTLLHYTDLVGLHYFNGGSKKAADALLASVPKSIRQEISVKAPPQIHVETRETDSEFIIHLVNGPEKNGGLEEMKPAKVEIALQRNDKRSIESIEMTEPGVDEGDELDWKTRKGVTRFTVDLDRYAMIILRYADAPETFNESPIASDDHLEAMVGVPLDITADLLLANDGDLERRGLRIVDITTTSASVGEILPRVPDGVVYRPPRRPVDRDVFRYTIADAAGQTASADIIMNVGPPASAYRPKWAVSMSGRLDAGTIASLEHADRETFDIAAAPKGKEGITEIVAGTWIADPLSEIDRLKVTVTGQFSRDAIEQTTRLYNFKRRAWQAFDTRFVGTGNDTTIAFEVPHDAVAEFVSSDAEMRINIEGRDSKSDFYAWTNEIRWDVIKFPR